MEPLLFQELMGKEQVEMIGIDFFPGFFFSEGSMKAEKRHGKVRIFFSVLKRKK